jgi:hypothetical protein
MSLKSGGFVLAAVILTVANTGSASAARVNSQVEIKSAGGLPGGGIEVRGLVDSSKSLCKKTRKVKAYHDVGPEGPSPGDFFLGSAVTNRRGKWRVSTEFEPDKVYARVVKKTKSGTTCKPAISPSVLVTP